MDNQIYIANELADTLDRLPETERDRVVSIIDSLAGDGWKNSQVVAADSSEGGGLRARLSGNLRLLFRYAPEQHAIIVTSVAAMHEQALVAAV